MADTSQPELSEPHTNGVIDGLTEEEKSKMRPADIDADMREMERRKRVEMMMNSRLFREELERIIETQMKDGSGPSGLLQQISEMMGPQGARFNANVFKNSNCVVPINDIRGVESMGYAKGEKLLRCKLAAIFRLLDLYGWTQGVGGQITARLNQDQEHFLVNPYGLLYHEVTASSLVKVDMQGAVVEQGTTNFGVHVTGFQLHSTIHAARPDIKCIVHIATPSVTAVSSMKCGLLPLGQESIVIGEVSNHQYIGGIFEPEEKEKITRNLGPINKVMLLTNRGAICCGATIEEAFFNVYNTVLACETQLKLMPAGLDNMNLISEESKKAIFEASRKPLIPQPSSVVEPSPLAEKLEKRWRIGGTEFEALMRMLDNAGFRTGYIYRHPLIKSEPPRIRNDVEVPPAVSSLGYLLEEEELYKQGLWKGGRKGTDRTRWLNSPNVYQKVEILETGTPDPKKITKWVDQNAEEWVTDGSPTHSSTPVKIESALQFVPKNTNPKEFKQLQQQIKDYRRADKISAGPQSHILEGVTWEEAKKMQDATISGTGEQVVLVGAASKGIIQRGFQHNAMVYKTPYAKNPFDAVTDQELDQYKKDVERKQKGDPYDESQSESEGLSSFNVSRATHESSTAKSPIQSPVSVTSETEEESRDEPKVLRIATKQVPVPSQPEVVLSDDQTVEPMVVETPLTQQARIQAQRMPQNPQRITAADATTEFLNEMRRSAIEPRNNVSRRDYGQSSSCSSENEGNTYSSWQSSKSYEKPQLQIARTTTIAEVLKPVLMKIPNAPLQYKVENNAVNDKNSKDFRRPKRYDILKRAFFNDYDKRIQAGSTNSPRFVNVDTSAVSKLNEPNFKSANCYNQPTYDVFFNSLINEDKSLKNNNISNNNIIGSNFQGSLCNGEKVIGGFENANLDDKKLNNVIENQPKKINPEIQEFTDWKNRRHICKEDRVPSFKIIKSKADYSLKNDEETSETEKTEEKRNIINRNKISANKPKKRCARKLNLLTKFVSRSTDDMNSDEVIIKDTKSQPISRSVYIDGSTNTDPVKTDFTIPSELLQAPVLVQEVLRSNLEDELNAVRHSKDVETDLKSQESGGTDEEAMAKCETNAKIDQSQFNIEKNNLLEVEEEERPEERDYNEGQSDENGNHSDENGNLWNSINEDYGQFSPGDKNRKVENVIDQINYIDDSLNASRNLEASKAANDLESKKIGIDEESEKEIIQEMIYDKKEKEEIEDEEFLDEMISTNAEGDEIEEDIIFSIQESVEVNGDFNNTIICMDNQDLGQELISQNDQEETEDVLKDENKATITKFDDNEHSKTDGDQLSADNTNEVELENTLIQEKQNEHLMFYEVKNKETAETEGNLINDFNLEELFSENRNEIFIEGNKESNNEFISDGNGALDRKNEEPMDLNLTKKLPTTETEDMQQEEKISATEENKDIKEIFSPSENKIEVENVEENDWDLNEFFSVSRKEILNEDEASEVQLSEVAALEIYSPDETLETEDFIEQKSPKMSVDEKGIMIEIQDEKKKCVEREIPSLIENKEAENEDDLKCIGYLTNENQIIETKNDSNEERPSDKDDALDDNNKENSDFDISLADSTSDNEDLSVENNPELNKKFYIFEKESMIDVEDSESKEIKKLEHSSETRENEKVEEISPLLSERKIAVKIKIDVFDEDDLNLKELFTINQIEDEEHPEAENQKNLIAEEKEDHIAEAQNNEHPVAETEDDDREHFLSEAEDREDYSYKAEGKEDSMAENDYNEDPVAETEDKEDHTAEKKDISSAKAENFDNPNTEMLSCGEKETPLKFDVGPQEDSSEYIKDDEVISDNIIYYQTDSEIAYEDFVNKLSSTEGEKNSSNANDDEDFNLKEMFLEYENEINEAEKTVDSLHEILDTHFESFESQYDELLSMYNNEFPSDVEKFEAYINEMFSLKHKELDFEGMFSVCDHESIFKADQENFEDFMDEDSLNEEILSEEHNLKKIFVKKEEKTLPDPTTEDVRNNIELVSSTSSSKCFERRDSITEMINSINMNITPSKTICENLPDTDNSLKYNLDPTNMSWIYSLTPSANVTSEAGVSSKNTSIEMVGLGSLEDLDQQDPFKFVKHDIIDFFDLAIDKKPRDDFFYLQENNRLINSCPNIHFLPDSLNEESLSDIENCSNEGSDILELPSSTFMELKKTEEESFRYELNTTVNQILIDLEKTEIYANATNLVDDILHDISCLTISIDVKNLKKEAKLLMEERIHAVFVAQDIVRSLIYNLSCFNVHELSSQNGRILESLVPVNTAAVEEGEEKTNDSDSSVIIIKEIIHHIIDKFDYLTPKAYSPKRLKETMNTELKNSPDILAEDNQDGEQQIQEENGLEGLLKSIHDDEVLPCNCSDCLPKENLESIEVKRDQESLKEYLNLVNKYESGDEGNFVPNQISEEDKNLELDRELEVQQALEMQNQEPEVEDESRLKTVSDPETTEEDLSHSDIDDLDVLNLKNKIIKMFALDKKNNIKSGSRPIKFKCLVPLDLNSCEDEASPEEKDSGSNDSPSEIYSAESDNFAEQEVTSESTDNDTKSDNSKEKEFSKKLDSFVTENEDQEFNKLWHIRENVIEEACKARRLEDLEKSPSFIHFGEVDDISKKTCPCCIEVSIEDEDSPCKLPPIEEMNESADFDYKDYSKFINQTLTTPSSDYFTCKDDSGASQLDKMEDPFEESDSDENNTHNATYTISDASDSDKNEILEYSADVSSNLDVRRPGASLPERMRGDEFYDTTLNFADVSASTMYSEQEIARRSARWSDINKQNYYSLVCDNLESSREIESSGDIENQLFSHPDKNPPDYMTYSYDTKEFMKLEKDLEEQNVTCSDLKNEKNTAALCSPPKYEDTSLYRVVTQINLADTASLSPFSIRDVSHDL